MQPAFNPVLDLKMERDVDVSPETIWEAWTNPKHLPQWFCPKPWRTTFCDMDVRPGGRFHSVMEGPEGEKFDNIGCYLEVVKNKTLIWTSALHENFRPAIVKDGCMNSPMTAGIYLEKTASGGTHYLAIARHPTEEAKKQHEAMGFAQGWGIALDQLIAYMKSL